MRRIARCALPALLAGAAALTTAAAAGAEQLRVMTYNILHGQPCSGGSLGSTIAPRMEFAVQGGPNHERGLVELAPDVLGMQEVSQVFVDETVEENQACSFLATLPPPAGGIPEGVTAVEAYEHQGDYLVRRMNGVAQARAVLEGAATSVSPTSASPWNMRFVRDNPRILAFVPDIPAPPGDETLSDHAARLANLEIGLAVITRLNTQRVVVHNLPPDGAQPAGTRALLHASLYDPATDQHYDFYNSHLTTTGGDSPATVAQAADIVDFVIQSRRHPENPAFFTCDCNALPGTLTHQTFEAAGYVDSFGAANPGADGFTGGRGQTCDRQAVRRIDYVWVIPDDQGRTPAIVSSEVVMDYQMHTSADDCIVPSNHLGVLTTFDMAVLN